MKKGLKCLATLLVAVCISAGLYAASVAGAPRGFIGDTGKGWDTTSKVRVRANSDPGRTGLQPINVIDGSGIDAMGEIHDGDRLHMWFTDFPFRGPRDGTEDTSGVWIEFAFDKPYILDKMWIWNYAENGWSAAGMKWVVIECTDVAGPDGWGSRIRKDWRTLYKGNLKYYEAGNQLKPDSLIDCRGASAKYVIITSASVDSETSLTFRSDMGRPFGDDTGLSEVRFYPKQAQQKPPQN